MAKWGHNLPAVLVPDGEICVQVAIPNHPDYIKLFLRAIRMLEVNRMYERDEALSAKIVVEQWRNRTITPLVEALANGLGCSDELSDCLEYPAYAGFIKYFPDNPYDNDPNPSAGYLLPAWSRWGNLETILPDFIDDFINHQIEQFTGYRNNDAICWISSLLSNNWLSWLNNGYVYPAIEIEVTGKGSIEIVLLSFPLGSRAIIEVDQAPNPLDILSGGIIDPNSFVVDTARDVTSWPPEEYPEVRFKVDIETEGDHTIYVLFLPVINFEISEEILNFGGGIRGVTLCGGLRPRNAPPPPEPPPLEGVEELRPEFQFTPDCGLEYRLRDQEDNVVQEWQPVPGWIDNAALCFGGGDLATKEDIRQALIEWTKDTALKIVSGATGNIEIDEDGNVVVGGDGDGDSELPEDDPATEINEAAAARSGGSSAVRIGINSIWTNMNTWYTADIPEAEVVDRLKLIYTLEEAEVAPFVTYYYAVRDIPASYVVQFSSTLDSYLFCKSNSLNVIAEWIFEVHPVSTQAMAAALLEMLTQAQLNDWFGQGAQIPSTDYIAYSCVPIDPEVFVLDSTYLNSNAYKTGAQIGKTNHRIRIDVSGKVFHPSDGSYQDFFYRVRNDGIKEFITNSGTYGTLQFNDTFGNPPQTKVPWRADGIYSVTMETTAAAAYRFRRVILNANQQLPNSGFTITLTDLGEVIS